ncbi:unnamed protein product, partial [Sphacelaria rigidula]
RGGGEEETLSGVECRTVHGKEAAAALTDVSETVPPTLSDVSRPPGDGTTNTIPSVSGVNSAGADAAAQTQPEDDPGESRNRRADGGLGGLRKHSALVDGRGLVPGEHVIGGDDERLVAALEEATGWRMKSRAAEAALADMRETLGDVLELSFRCGEEHGCHNRASEKIATTSADATVDSVDGDQQGVEAASAAFAGKGPESRDKNFAGGAVTSRLTTPDPVANDEEGGNDDMEKKGGERVPDEECAGKAGTWRCSAGGRLSGRCGACEARAKAVHELLSRLQSTSIAQHNDIVRMEASLARLRDARHPADASPNTTASNSPAAESTQHFSGTSCTATDTSRAIRHPQKDHQQQHHQQQHRSLSGRPSFDTESSSNRFVGGDGHQPSFSFDGMDSDNQHASSSGQKATATAVEMPKENTWRGHGLAWSESSSDISPSAVGAAAKQRRKMSVDVMSTGVEDDYGGRGDGVRSSGSLGGGRRDVRTEWQEFEGLDAGPAHHHVGGSGGLGSPMVQGVLDRWIDVSKRRILEGWLAHVLHGGPVDAANGCFVPRVQISSLSKEVRDGLVSVVLPLLLHRRGVLLQVLTRERVEVVHDIQIRVTPVAG